MIMMRFMFCLNFDLNKFFLHKYFVYFIKVVLLFKPDTCLLFVSLFHFFAQYSNLLTFFFFHVNNFLFFIIQVVIFLE